MTAPVEVRLLFFVDREGVARVRVASDGQRGSVYAAYDGAQHLVGLAVTFETRALNELAVAAAVKGEPLNDEKGGTP